MNWKKVASSWVLLIFAVGQLGWSMLSGIVSNWLALHGKKITGLEEFAKEVIKDKTGHDASMIQITDSDAAHDRSGTRPEVPESPADGR